MYKEKLLGKEKEADPPPSKIILSKLVQPVPVDVFNKE